MKDAVIFDFDGVIVDSEPIRYETYKQLFANEYSVTLDDKDPIIVGRKPEENLAYFLKKYNLEGDVTDLMNKREQLLKKVFSKKEIIKPIHGLFDLLKYLKSCKIKLAIASCSSKEYVDIILTALDLVDVFDVIITGEMISKGKPNPEVYAKAAAKLNKGDNCVVIEDSPHGIVAAKAAGIKVIAVTTSFSREQLGLADMIVDDLSQIRLEDI